MCRRPSSFHDVLLAGAGGLDHLIDSAVSFIEQIGAELDSGVIDDFSLLERKEILVATVWWDDTVDHGVNSGEGARAR
jgi:hypothetical protein